MNIAIPDLEVLVGMEPGEGRLISSVIRSHIEDSAAFSVVERLNMDKVIEAVESNMAAAGEEEAIAVEGVDQLLLGTIGKLYGKTVITLKLVDLKTSKVLFAATRDFPEADTHSEAERLVAELNRKASYRMRRIRPEEILQAEKEEDFIKVRDLLDVYKSQNSGPLPDELAAVKEGLEDSLADSYLEEAEQEKKDKNFDEALRLVGLAIALQPGEEAFHLRDEIDAAKIVYEEEQERYRKLQREAEEKKSQERLRKLTADPFESVESYYQLLRPGGTAVGIDQMWFADESLDLPAGWGSPGAFCRFSRTWNQEDEGQGYVEVNSLGVLELAVYYRQAGHEPAGYYLAGQNSLALSAAVSPFSTLSLKFFNLMVNAGLDAGVVLMMQSGLPGGAAVYPSAGLSGEVALKLLQKGGITLRGRTEYLFDTEQISRDGISVSGDGLRMVLGLGVSL